MTNEKTFTVNTKTEDHTRVSQEPFRWPEHVETWALENARLDSDREKLSVLTWNSDGECEKVQSLNSFLVEHE